MLNDDEMNAGEKASEDIVSQSVMDEVIVPTESCDKRVEDQSPTTPWFDRLRLKAKLLWVKIREVIIQTKVKADPHLEKIARTAKLHQQKLFFGLGIALVIVVVSLLITGTHSRQIRKIRQVQQSDQIKTLPTQDVPNKFTEEGVPVEADASVTVGTLRQQSVAFKSELHSVNMMIKSLNNTQLTLAKHVEKMSQSINQLARIKGKNPAVKKQLEKLKLEVKSMKNTYDNKINTLDATQKKVQISLKTALDEKPIKLSRSQDWKVVAVTSSSFLLAYHGKLMKPYHVNDHVPNLGIVKGVSGDNSGLIVGKTLIPFAQSNSF